ncbi:spore coat protein [Paenibacillus sp.]|uniref:spore coat protein n=1 Tax=Paenibacillus sp. TaxID=58172 RepID=UPI00281271C2|nr:spore coat protein [Paenibacillus sp.]
MNIILEKLTGLGSLTDQVVAMDFLNTVKSGVRNYAMAVTDTVTPEIKTILSRQLEELIDLHERVATYAAEKGIYHPWNVTEQIEVDLNHIEMALKAPTL